MCPTDPTHNLRFLRRILVFILPTLLTIPILVRAHTATYFSIIGRWHLGGAGGWNRLTTDPGNHRLYITRGEKIIVVNTLTGEQTAEITGSKSTRTVCLNPNGRTGYFTDSASGVVRVFDRASFRVIASVETGIDPDAAAFDAQTDTLLVANDGSKNATVIDALNNRIAATIALPGRPAFTVTDGDGVAFVNLNDIGAVARIDMRSHKLMGTWPMPGCSGPSGLAISETQHALFSACENNRVLALDMRTGQLLSSADVPEGTRDIAIDARRNLLFAASGGGTLSVLTINHTGQLAISQTVKTMPGARTLAVDSSTGYVYLDTSQFGLRTGETSEELRFRPTPVANTFVVLIIAR